MYLPWKEKDEYFLQSNIDTQSHQFTRTHTHFNVRQKLSQLNRS